MKRVDRETRLKHLMEGDIDIFRQRLSEVMTESKISSNRFDTDGVCSRGSATAYKQGDYMPSSRCLFNICRYLNVSADWLLGLTDERRTVW